MPSVMAAMPFAIHTVLTSILFERYEQSDGLKCKLDRAQGTDCKFR